MNAILVLNNRVLPHRITRHLISASTNKQYTGANNFRWLSASASASKSNDKQPEIIYKSSSALLPRALLSISSLNALYWSWYLYDFMPTMLTSQLNIYPELGYIGFTVSIGMFVGSCMYPKYLISEITMQQDNQSYTGASYQVKRHTLPFCNMESIGIQTPKIEWMYNDKSIDSHLNEHLFLKLDDPTNKKLILHVRPHELMHYDVWDRIYHEKLIYEVEKKDNSDVRTKRRLLKEERLRRRSS